MKVEEIMASPVIVANENETLREVAIKMLSNRIGGLPVINDDGDLVGFLSETDFTAKKESIPFSRYEAPQLFGKWVNKNDIDEMYDEAKKVKVKEVMTENVVYLSPDDNIEDFVDKIIEHKFYRFPVVKDGKPVGMVSRRDLLKLIIK